MNDVSADTFWTVIALTWAGVIMLWMKNRELRKDLAGVFWQIGLDMTEVKNILQEIKDDDTSEEK